MAPPAHTSVLQGAGPYIKQTLFTKGCADTSKEPPMRSG